MIYPFLPEEKGLQKTVLTAMNYSVKAGGKRLRPMLMEETYKMFGGEEKVIEPFMAAIEMIHTYSLIHDDLPALDNDDYRRGQKTCHIVYGEDMAILAGDALLNYAFETASSAFALEDADLPKVAEAIRILARKPGIYGMIGGQAADVELEGTVLSMEQIMFIHHNKTSALIEACMMIGAVLAGASPEDVKAMEKNAKKSVLPFRSRMTSSISQDRRKSSENRWEAMRKIRRPHMFRSKDWSRPGKMLRGSHWRQWMILRI